jgi:hypothetical protein
MCKFRFAMLALALGRALPRITISALRAVAITIHRMTRFHGEIR